VHVAAALEGVMRFFDSTNGIVARIEQRLHLQP
jgi:hypothetical protein